MLILTDEQVMLRDMVRDFARKEIAPKAEHYDRTAEFPWEVVKKAQEIGLTSLNIPDEYGGGGANVFEECLVNSELAWGCSGMSTILAINNLATLPITVSGTHEQKKEWFGRIVEDNQLIAYAVTEPAAGSDVIGMQTRAVKKGDKYILNGTKTFISNANTADFYTLFAVTDPEAGHRGLAVFVVEKDSPGLTVGKHFDKLGQRCADTAEISLKDVEVPAANLLGGKEGQGFYTAMKVFDKSRGPTAAGAVGVAQRAVDESLRYAAERETFGKPIYKHQVIGDMLARMAIGLEAARSLLFRAATAVDNDHPEKTKLVSMAKAYCADTAMQITIDAVQIFGGYGFMKEYPVEKLMRDVKVFQIYEGTSQIQRTVVTRELYRS